MAKKFRGQEAILEIADSSGTSIPVGILDDPEVTAPEQEVQELRGAGSTEWQDLQKTETKVTVSGTVAEMALDAWDQLIDYDDTAGALDDSAEVATFEITVTYTAASDGSTKEILVRESYVDGSIPLGGARDEWIGMDLSFNAKTLDITNADASA